VFDRSVYINILEFDWMLDIRHQQQKIWIINMIISSVLKPDYIYVKSMHAHS